MSRPRILVFAYACEPGKGSEPGVGWGLVQSLARWSDPVVLVGPEHAEGIASWRNENAGAPIEFIVVAEPGWAKRVPHEPASVSRLNAIGYFIAYLGWQRRAASEARRLWKQQKFDYVFHATYSTYWLPSPGRHLNAPLIWGPVGGGVTTPRPLWRFLGPKGMLSELIDAVAVRAASLWPSTRRTWQRADTRILNNEDSQRRLRPSRDSDVLLNHAAFTISPPTGSRPPRDGFMLFLASFESRKGVGLALHGLARTPANVTMIVVGDGPERERTQRLAAELGIEDRIDLRGWLPYSEAQELLDTAGALVSTGVREEGGAALAEAMIRGCPVIVLANGGARTLAESATDLSRVRLIRPAPLPQFAEDLAKAMAEFSHAGAGGSPNLDTEAAHRSLQQSFLDAAARFERKG